MTILLDVVRSLDVAKAMLRQMVDRHDAEFHGPNESCGDESVNAARIFAGARPAEEVGHSILEPRDMRETIRRGEWTPPAAPRTECCGQLAESALYEALHDVLQVSYENADDWQSAVVRGRAALAKAEGR